MEKINGNKWEPKFDDWWTKPIVPEDIDDTRSEYPDDYYKNIKEDEKGIYGSMDRP
jgi:hypothetical protein